MCILFSLSLFSECLWFLVCQLSHLSRFLQAFYCWLLWMLPSLKSHGYMSLESLSLCCVNLSCFVICVILCFIFCHYLPRLNKETQRMKVNGIFICCPESISTLHLKNSKMSVNQVNHNSCCGQFISAKPHSCIERDYVLLSCPNPPYFWTKNCVSVEKIISMGTLLQCMYW